MVTVREIYDYLDKIAPFAFAESFDNSGLLIGDFDDEIKKVLLALDITNNVAEEALNRDFDLIISHHPVIFDPIKKLDRSNPACRLFTYLIDSIAMHTNLDMTKGGVTDIMAELLGMENDGIVLSPVYKKPYYQVSVFVPEEAAKEVYKAMSKAGAGKLGNYKGCAFFIQGEGYYTPNKDANPYKGSAGKTTKAFEVKIEMLVKPTNLDNVINEMLSAHPYEEPAYDISENHALYEEIGYGKICTLEEEVDALTLAQMVKKAFDCQVVRYTDGGVPIKKVALCSGSGGNDYELAYKMGADAYITGDVKHNQWIGAENLEFTLIDGGHFYTENIVLKYLQKKLKKHFPDLKVEIAKNNFDVVKYVL